MIRAFRHIATRLVPMIAAVATFSLPGPWIAGASADYEAGQVVAMLQPGFTIDEVNARWGTTTLDAFPEGNLYLLDATGLGDVEQLAEQMEAIDAAILEAEANYYQRTAEDIRQMVIVVVGGGYSEYEDQTIGSRIGLAEAHLETRGAGVTVAVLDTGIDPVHPAFAGRLAADGYDFVDGDAQPWDEGNGIDDDGDTHVDEGVGHGTMVAGIVALVAPQATLLPVRVLSDEGHGDAFAIAKGIRYAANHGATVLNCSFGVPQNISIIAHQLEFVRSQGIVIVAGAGNDAMEQAYFPGRSEYAELVTAVDSLDIKASFSDWHDKVLVSAPGTGVRSAYPGDRWAIGNGCSFATPFVSGEAALIRSVRTTASPDEVRQALESAVVPIDGLPGNDPYAGQLGSGRIHLAAAVQGFASAGSFRASGGVTLRAAPAPSSGEVRFEFGEEGLAPGVFEVAIYDVGGRLVRALPPSARPVWDGLDAASRPAAPGVYLARATAADGRTATRRIAVVR